MADTLLIVCPNCDTLNRVPAEKLAASGRCGNCREPLFDKHPVALGAGRFERHLDKSDIPLLIDFWALWCGPCHAMAPAFERAAAELEPRVRLVKLNVDEEPALAARFGIHSIPTIVLALHGRQLARVSGVRSAAELTRWTLGVLKG